MEEETKEVKTQPKQRKKAKRWPLVLLIILFAIGLGILLYPIISNLWNTYVQQQLIGAYNNSVEETIDTNQELYEAEWEKAFAYNDSLWPTPYPENFAFLNDNDPTPEYMDCLNLNGDGIMGYVKIPKIGVEIPIYHTTDEEDVLARGAEHLEGTSLPIGGENTHCVLSAHRGLPGSALFTDLDQMEIGDHFFLHVLGDTLCYEVDNVETVEPDNVSGLVIQEGQDLCTLLTCTPYGVNTHRLLVTGHRVDYEEETAVEEENMGPLKGGNLYTLCVILATIAVIILVIVLIVSTHKRNKRRKQQPSVSGDNENEALGTDTDASPTDTKLEGSGNAPEPDTSSDKSES